MQEFSVRSTQLSHTAGAGLMEAAGQETPETLKTPFRTTGPLRTIGGVAGLAVPGLAVPEL